MGREEEATAVVTDLATESLSRIRRVIEGLEGVVDPEYWEFTARGIDFAFLEPDRRTLLREVLRRVEAARA